MFVVSLLSGRVRDADLLGFLGEMVNVRLVPKWLHILRSY